MQFTIAKDEFLRGLSRIQSVIEKKTTLAACAKPR